MDPIFLSVSPKTWWPFKFLDIWNLSQDMQKSRNCYASKPSSIICVYLFTKSHKKLCNYTLLVVLYWWWIYWYHNTHLTSVTKMVWYLVSNCAGDNFTSFSYFRSYACYYQMYLYMTYQNNDNIILALFCTCLKETAMHTIHRIMLMYKYKYKCACTFPVCFNLSLPTISMNRDFCLDKQEHYTDLKISNL